MKFIHTADLHLGAEPDAGKKYSEGRGREIWDTFSRLTGVCESCGTDLLLIAGDLFHRQPLLRELKEINYLFSKLTKTKVVLIAGNHDYLKWDSYYRTFKWSENVYPLFGDRLQCVRFPELETCVYGLSYYQREIKSNRYEKARPWGKEKYEILLAHGGDEKHIPVTKNDLVSLGYDYVAMGHIHKPGALVENKVVYAGALEPVDKNDTGAHGYMAGEITDKGTEVRFVPFASREYVHMEIVVDETMTDLEVREKVKREIQRRGTGNIYKVILKGLRSEEVLFRLVEMDAFGNVLEVEDKTRPAYNFNVLQKENADNLLGDFIRSFAEFPRDSVEYMALCEGVEALLETKRG